MGKLNISIRNIKDKDENITDIYVDGHLGFSRLVYFLIVASTIKHILSTICGYLNANIYLTSALVQGDVIRPGKMLFLVLI